MGSNKALLPYRGGRFIEAVRLRLYRLFDEVLVVTNTPEHYSFLGGRLVQDIHCGMGVLGGLHAGLAHSRTSHIFAVACDMPCLNEALIKALTARWHQADVVIPEGEGGLEPLHAVYGRGCLPYMEASLADNKRRIVSFFPSVEVARFGKESVAAIDPGFDSFRNVTPPEDYFALRGCEAFGLPPARDRRA
jgi:molybdopterin-guanine dinucleotide biosynthesis protein A